MPEAHVARTADLGMSAQAVTEHGNTSSHVKHEKAANAHGIKPLYGCELYTAAGQTQAKWHLTALAETQDGYQNLNRLVSRSWAEGFYYWPTVSGEMLRDHAEGLVVLSGCSDSLLNCTLLGGKANGPKREAASSWDIDAAEQVVWKFKDILGDGYYLETQQFPELERTRTLNPILAELSRRCGVPLVATADVHYPMPEDNEMQKILHAAGRGSGSVEAQEATWEYDIKLTLPTSDMQIRKALMGTGLTGRQAEQAIYSTGEIADRCTVILPRNERIRWPLQEGYSSSRDLVWEWLRDGWRYRWDENLSLQSRKTEYYDRLQYEMHLVESKDFLDYFLMLSYLVRWAKGRGIVVGPARGSAASSLVCYLLRITEIDPLQFPTMMFERFIDATREDLPDVDLDFQDNRRHEVFDEAARVFGKDHVGQLGNFVRYRGRNSVNDVARVYRVPKYASKTVNDLLIDRSQGDSRLESSLEDTVQTFPAAAQMFDQFPDLRYAFRLEGNMQSFGVHAAGIVISNDPITDTCAIYEREVGKEKHRVSVVAYDKKDAEYLGMLKADFLGLSNMGMLGRVLELIRMPLEDLYRIPLDDEKTMDGFRNNDVIGVFQFEGRATRLVCREVVPDNFNELADINALSRPGPLFSGMKTRYVGVKHGTEKEEHLHAIVDKHTESTKFQIVYQEQVLAIIREIGGFPVSKVADIRKIISQKLGEAQFNNMIEAFIEGADRLHGIKRDLAVRIWKYMVTSATYSFCCTGDTIVERGGAGRYCPDPKATIAELYEAQESRTPIGDKMRTGKGIRILSMDDDGRVRPNRLVKIHHPVPYRCLRIKTKGVRTITFSNDHQVLTTSGYKHALELTLGDEVIVALGKAEREAERLALKGPNAHASGGHWDMTKGKSEGNPGWIDGRSLALRNAQIDVLWRSGGKCEHCGEPGSAPHDLEFAHVLTLTDCDGDYLVYHTAENLLHLCNSCHKKFDYVQGTRVRRWSRGRPTAVDVIVSIEDAGVQDVYEISMEGPSHNYIGNDLVHHNNIAHSASYSMVSYWNMYLKQHHPLAFYSASAEWLGRMGKWKEKGPRLLRDAQRKGIRILPPDPGLSDARWTPVLPAKGSNDLGGIRAGFEQVPGVGDRTAAAMLTYRSAFLGSLIGWEDFVAVSGIGAKTIDKIRAFAEDDDPFGLDLVGKVLRECREGLRTQTGFWRGLPKPTHTSEEMLSAPDGARVVWIGVAKAVEYKDLIEDQRARYGTSVEEILASNKDSHLRKWATIHAYDDGDEEVYLRFNRYNFPKFKTGLETLRPDADVLLIIGEKNRGFGNSLKVKKMMAIDPEDEGDDDSDD